MGTNWRRVEPPDVFPVQISRNRGLRLLLIEEFLVLARPAIGSPQSRDVRIFLLREELMARADNNVSILQLQDFESSLVEPPYSDLIVPNVSQSDITSSPAV
jgi:hypothetical protein